MANSVIKMTYSAHGGISINFFVMYVHLSGQCWFTAIECVKESIMPCPFTGPKMFWNGPNVLCHTKNLFTYCGNHK